MNGQLKVKVEIWIPRTKQNVNAKAQVGQEVKKRTSYKSCVTAKAPLAADSVVLDLQFWNLLLQFCKRLVTKTRIFINSKNEEIKARKIS